jgi:hypothetical protein
VAYSEQVLQYLPEGTEETRKTWARRLCIPADFRTGNLPNKAAHVHLLAVFFMVIAVWPAGPCLY